MSDLIDAFARWLPMPEYRFVGGPMDGKVLAVSLCETPDGMVAPEVWNVADIPSVEIAEFDKEANAMKAECAVHRYRFVNTAYGNQGHYEFINP